MIEHPESQQEIVEEVFDDTSLEGYTPVGRDRKSLAWKSCLLLLALSLSLVVTPLAILYRLRSGQQGQQQLTNSIEKGPAVIQEPDDDSRIAYITSEHQLATIAPDGSEVRQLTDSNLQFQFPAWSPDGSQLAVIGGDGLYIITDSIATATNELQALFRNPDESPFYHYWAPDSEQVTFLANHPEGIALHLVNVKGGIESERQLVVGQPLYWDWMPSGDRILMNTGIAGVGGRVALIDPTGISADEQLAESGLFQAPGFSASGSYRSYARFGEDDLSHLVVQNDTGQIIVEEPHFGQIAVIWSPTADRLAFTAPVVDSVRPFGPLRILDPVSGDSRVLTQATVLAFFWSPDGEKIAYLTIPQRNDDSIQAVSFRPGQEVLGDQPVQIQNGGLELWVVNADTGFQKQLLTFRPSDVFIHQFLPFFDQYALSHRLWSPKSDALVLPMMQNGIAHVTIVDADNGAVKILAGGDIGFWSR